MSKGTCRRRTGSQGWGGTLNRHMPRHTGVGGQGGGRPTATCLDTRGWRGARKSRVLTHKGWGAGRETLDSQGSTSTHRGVGRCSKVTCLDTQGVGGGAGGARLPRTSTPRASTHTEEPEEADTAADTERNITHRNQEDF